MCRLWHVSEGILLCHYLVCVFLNIPPIWRVWCRCWQTCDTIQSLPTGTSHQLMLHWQKLHNQYYFPCSTNMTKLQISHCWSKIYCIVFSGLGQVICDYCVLQQHCCGIYTIICHFVSSPGLVFEWLPVIFSTPVRHLFYYPSQIVHPSAAFALLSQSDCPLQCGICFTIPVIFFLPRWYWYLYANSVASPLSHNLYKIQFKK